MNCVPSGAISARTRVGLMADDAEDIGGRDDCCWRRGRRGSSSGRPAIWCSTLGSFDLSRVPLPAARMAMAKRGFGMRCYCNAGKRVAVCQVARRRSIAGGFVSGVSFACLTGLPGELCGLRASGRLRLEGWRSLRGVWRDTDDRAAVPLRGSRALPGRSDSASAWPPLALAQAAEAVQAG